ncbi:protein ACCELERATED CELL DEATH 6-like [Macadamia integrifolia]|uniref:protein ACCELERATED CELL DEATH 6-like n=1 Tax=Macadamia integrifolia TaxID=60698 RepID=UPI001C4EF8EA|nr:protein ACCELERATED CELL DEATH 6-like [Macadamia integrifolia]
MERLMSKRLYEAATTGDKKVFEEKNEMLHLFTWTHEENNCLHIAARFGHEEFIRRVLSLCPTLLYQLNSREDNPLHVAARAGYFRVVKVLTDTFQHLQLQPPETSTGSSSDSKRPLREAEEGGRSSSSLMWTVQKEQNNISSPPRYRSESREIWRSQNCDGSTALHEALRGKHEDVALHLLDLDSEVLVHVVNSRNESPLYLAAEAGLVRALNKILGAGGHLNTAGPKDQTPFHAAVLPGSAECIKILYERIPELIKVQDLYGKTALHYATQEKSLKIMDLLLELDASSAYIRDKDGLTPLLVAASIGPPESVRIILDACPGSIESLDNMGRNALHLAVMHSAVKYFSKISRMPEMKAIINEPDNEGNTPLHLATMGHKYLQARALLSTKHVDLTAKNHFGQTALDMSVLDWELSIRQVFYLSPHEIGFVC